ncbi:hypothetical protein [Leucothrix mucor]|uniref:hypothetical protein n=1 Tax=Leucothrix mucor TaxID=45248 RepID=UPI0003B61931|nr:hypothetical protein [Leucothrix mucor]
MEVSWLFRVAQAILLTISALTTMYGLSFFIDGPTVNIFGSKVDILIVVVIFVVIALTFAMFHFLEQLFSRTTSAPKKFFSLILYLVFACISITFAYGFWWKGVAFAGWGTTEYEKIITKTKTELSGLDQSISSLLLDSKSLKSTSDRKMKQEVEEGSSCDGSTSGAGAGRIFDERSEITKRISDFTFSLENQLHSKQKALVSKIEDVTSSLVQVSRTLEAKELQGEVEEGTNIINSIVTSFNSELDSYKAAEESKLNRIERAVQKLPNSIGITGYSFLGERKCNDAELAQAIFSLKRKLSGFSAIKTINSDAITTIDPVEVAIKSLVRKGINIMPGSNLSATHNIHLTALILAFLIDGFIFLFSLFVKRPLIKRDQTASWLSDNFDEKEISYLNEITSDYALNTSEETLIPVPSRSWKKNQADGKAQVSDLNGVIHKLRRFKIVNNLKSGKSKKSADSESRIQNLGWERSLGEAGPEIYIVVDSDSWEKIRKGLANTDAIKKPSGSRGRPTPATNTRKARY